ncbi:MAG: hypothetical protein JWN10_1427, partial [Solirubrobacterales bacterium]|nr:hypothetical protein [Solirubrobacterales bacterium]
MRHIDTQPNSATTRRASTALAAARTARCRASRAFAHAALVLTLALTALSALSAQAAPAAAAGTMYFVAPGGSDALACSANSHGSPFATIQKALSCAGNGDVISLAPS